MGVWLGPMGGKFKNQNDYSFIDSSTGTNTSEFYSENNNWEIVLKSSGTFKFLKKPGLIELFIVGGGGTGKSAKFTSDSGILEAGAGGNGGECKTIGKNNNFSVLTNTNYSITIGYNGTDTIGFNQIARGGNSEYWSDTYGKKGGIGSKCNQYSGEYGPGNGTQGSLAFGEGNTLYENGTPIYFGPSGGGGGTSLNYSTQNGGSGANTGSGHGGAGTSSPSNGQDAQTQNTGAAAGGGGGLFVTSNWSATIKNGGTGGSGIIIIRNHRST